MSDCNQRGVVYQCYRLVDVQVKCGSMYRYKFGQVIEKSGKRAEELQPGDTLPVLPEYMNVPAPCECPVVNVWRIP